jgi:hypothetical protein
MAENPDVAVACRAGQVASAQEHFTQNGYFEGRLPFKITVDEDWYLKAYPDVANGIAAGAFASAQEHFVAIGYLEGRLPRPNVGWLTTAQISNLLQAADLSARMRQNRPAVRSGRTDPGHLLRLAGLVSDLPGLSAGSSGMIQEVFKADFGTESRPEPQKRELSLQRRKRNGGFKPD